MLSDKERVHYQVHCQIKNEYIVKSTHWFDLSSQDINLSTQVCHRQGGVTVNPWILEKFNSQIIEDKGTLGDVGRLSPTSLRIFSGWGLHYVVKTSVT